MIFLDNASTTKVDESTIEIMNHYYNDLFFNPSASYAPSTQISEKIIEAKKQILKPLKIDYNNNLIITGSATEANNLALLGSIKSNFKKILVSMGEHPSVFNTAKSLQEKGYNVQFIKLNEEGTVDLEDYKSKLSSKDVSFVSIIHVNNETGAINPINKLAQLAKEANPNCIFHSDGVQSFCKINVNLENIDLYTISAHKINGPKGVGALFVRNIKALKPINYGGGQEFNIRSGTENVPAILGFANAVANFNTNINFEKVSELQKVIFNELSNKQGIVINSKIENSPYIISVSFDKIRGETLLHKLEEDEIFISTGSACSSKKLGENRILQAMGLPKNLIIGSVRISLSKNTTYEEVKIFCEKVISCYNSLRLTLGV